MSFFLGCAVWAFKGWLGDLFPAGSPSTKFLSLYSRSFTTVEGNTTFYMVPDANTIERWVADTPLGFELCLKLPRDLTHDGPLAPKVPGALRFLAHMQRLGDRLGPIFAQLPPSYGPSLMGDLHAFLAAWPRSESPLALEVRHMDWFREPWAGRLSAMLEALGVGRVLLDSRPVYREPGDPQARSERRKPRVPLQPILTAPFSLVRFVSHPVQERNTTYLKEWVAHCTRWLQRGVRVYFFVHCPDEARTPGNARYFQKLLEEGHAPVPPLPWNLREPAATQLRLF